jgi:hypothetical protein
LRKNSTTKRPLVLTRSVNTRSFPILLLTLMSSTQLRVIKETHAFKAEEYGKRHSKLRETAVCLCRRLDGLS